MIAQVIPVRAQDRYTGKAKSKKVSEEQEQQKCWLSVNGMRIEGRCRHNVHTPPSAKRSN